MKTTESTYNALTKAYKHFNKTLFNNVLPECLFTLQRKNKTYGYFASKRFGLVADSMQTIDEIAMNPSAMKDRPVKDTLSTLVHEMVHLKQYHFGNPSNGYHNKEWASMMLAIGLVPSNTGQEGGKQTGVQMTHYIEPNGLFDVHCDALLATGFVIPVTELWTESDKLKAKKKSASKTKFTCPECNANVWGKPDTNVMCGDCSVTMEILD